MSSLTVVVITYNSGDVVGPCVDSCLQFGYDVVVIDNASTDRTRYEVARRHGARLIENAVNTGFAAAANQGFAAAGSELILLLNPDARLATPVDALTQSFADPRVAAATGELAGSSGESQHRFHLRNLPRPETLVFEALGLNRIWPGNPVNRKYRLKERPAAAAFVEQPAAAFLMVRKTAWLEIGGFDEEFYPIWFEDVDFCERLRQAGYGIVYRPEAVAHHDGGHSATAMSWETRHLAWYGSLLRYASKHFSMGERRAVALSVLVGSLARTSAQMGRRFSLKPLKAYSGVVRLVRLCLRSGDSRRFHRGGVFRKEGEQARF